MANEGVLCIPQISKTGASSSDSFLSYLGHFGESYPSAEMQLVYYTALADWFSMCVSVHLTLCNVAWALILHDYNVDGRWSFILFNNQFLILQSIFFLWLNKVLWVITDLSRDWFFEYMQFRKGNFPLWATQTKVFKKKKKKKKKKYNTDLWPKTRLSQTLKNWPFHPHWEILFLF